MVGIACPTAEELQNYTLGRLTEKDWAAISDHVESCPHCQAAIATVDDVADTLVTQLREPAPGDSFLNESQCEAALKRAAGIAASECGAGESPVECGTGILPVLAENNTGRMPVPPDASRSQGSVAFPFKEIGEYQILEELGQGGMGAVYKALHTKLDRVVAIKVLSRGRSGDERAIARFEREMKAVGRFDHPHIVRAYDAREIGGVPVLIMEFVEGMDLGCLVRRLGSLPTAEACELVRQAAVGLQYIHERGLVHRDLKPSNLMLTPQGIVKILDLGLARFHFDQPEEEMTNSGQAMGTADYMAPEQASDSHGVDIRADIYSLGCTLYKLLAGCAPFEGSQYKGTFEKMTAHVQQKVTQIENILPQIPRELASIIEKMLAKNPADRFAQPADVIEALSPFCRDAALPALLTRAEEAKTVHSREFPAHSPMRQEDHSPSPQSQSIRRRTWVAIAIGLLMLGLGLGFSLGIMVMIKKDGKTTTVDAPEGSNVQVNEHGNVTVDLNQLKDQSATDFHRIDLSAADGKAAVPPEPYTIWPGDSLVIRAVGTIIDAPVDGVYVVEPEGTVALPPDYGRVNVKGMSLVEAEPAIVKHLGKVLRSPEVSVTLASWVDRSKPQPNQQPHCVSPGNVLNIWACGTIIDQPIHGPYLVESDGQVTLGPAYGRVNLKGQTFEEAEKTVTKQLNEILRAPEVSITLEGWRKELKPSPEEELKKELAKAKKSIEQLQRANRSKEVTPPKQPEKKKEPNPPDDNKNDLSKGEDKEPKPPAFRTATATRGNIQTMVSATGKLEPERVVDVTAQVSGKIVSLGDDPRGATDPSYKGKTIDYNSLVEEGTVLARIDDTLYKLQVEQEEANYKRAEFTYTLTEQRHKMGNASQVEYVEAEAAFEKSKTAIKEAKINLERTVIKSPIKGVIIARRINVGQNVAPSSNDIPSLFLIAKDLRKMQVWASVNEADMGRIHEGMTARFTVDAFPKETYEGKVVQIRQDATQIQNAVVYTVVISFENPDLKLLPYMTANLKFEIVTPNIKVKISGPDKSVIGNIARFAIVVTNTGSKIQNNLKVVVSYDPALVPKMTTDKFHSDGKSIFWMIDTLPPGESRKFEIDYKCEKINNETFNRVNVISEDGGAVETSAFLRIESAELKKEEKNNGDMGPQAASIDNLKKIMIAMHVYHDEWKRFPPAYKADKNGKMLLSWRVLLLPALGEDELYKQFKLDEPWNSENNIKLIAKIPAVYKSPGIRAGEGKTNYQTVRSEGTVFPGNEKVRLAELRNGSANVIALVETTDEKAVRWTQPYDFEYGKENPLKGLVGLYPDVFLVAFADGRVQVLPNSIDPEILKCLFACNFVDEAKDKKTTEWLNAYRAGLSTGKEETKTPMQNVPTELK